MLLLGKKIGMTRVYDDAERSVAVTAVQVGPCYVTQVRTPDRDGYSAVQIGFDEMSPRTSTQPMIGHDAKAGVAPQRTHVEFRVDEDGLGEYELGQALGVDRLEGVMFVDVSATSKGKGFQGGMKRHNFRGQLASHGVERKHRSPGSIGGHASNAGASGKLKKGKRMSGHMGAERVTVRSMDVVRIDADRGLLLVKGAVPGPNGSVVQIRPAARLNKGKQNRMAAAAG